MEDGDIEIEINPEILNHQLQTPKIEKPINRYFNSSTFHTNYNIGPAKMKSHFKSTSSNIKKDISFLNNKLKENMKDRIIKENAICLLKNKLKMLSMEENKTQNKILNVKNSQREILKIKEERRKSQKILERNKQLKEEEIKKKKEQIKTLRMKDRQNSQIKKRQYENNKEINGKEIFCERRRNEDSIKKEKEKDFCEKREKILKIKELIKEKKKKKLLKELIEQEQLKRDLQIKVNQQEKYNKILSKEIEKYQLQGLKAIERINTLAIA
jgi:hypothetical protein